ncbi:MAG: hypothetical protein ACRYE9_04300 [Janthinobacterium lividum]
MLKIRLQKLEAWARQIYNYFTNSRSIIIFIGINGTFLTATKNNQPIDSLFISLENRGDIEYYKGFLKKYNKFYIFFLYEDENCELKHESIPTFQSVVRINPVKQFIAEHYEPQDITSFKVYDITPKNGETWNTLISKIPYRPPLSDLLNYVLSKHLRFGGIYHLSLEYINIINKILKNHEGVGKFHIFVYVSQANAIKFIVKHDNNIITMKSVIYPVDRTESYIQGIIEQEISDYLIYYKNYLIRQNLQVCLVFLVSNSLKKLLRQSKFDLYKIICLTDADLNQTHATGMEREFSDSALIKLFISNKTFSGSNKAIKSITRANLVDFLAMRILNAIVIVLLLIILNIKFLTYSAILKGQTLDARNYLILQEYRDIGQKYPNVKNAANLADLYSLAMLLKIPIITPLEFLEKILSNLSSNINLEKISWKMNAPNNLVQKNNYINIDVSLKYSSNNLEESSALRDIELYIKEVQKKFDGFLLTTQVSYNVIKLLDRIIIPISFSMTGPKTGSKEF